MQKSNSVKIENLMAIKYSSSVEVVVTQPVSELKCKGLEVNLEKET